MTVDLPVPSAPSRRRWRGVVVAVPALVAVACASVVMEQAVGEEPLVIDEPAAVVEPVDVVDDAPLVVEGAVPVVPTVAAGTCRLVVYTPPTAAAPMSGELCVPLESTGAAVILVHGGGGYTGSADDTDAWRDVHLQAGRTTFAIEYALLDEGAGPDAPALWPRAEQNVMAAVQWLRLDGTLATGEILLHGFSAGARLAAIVATAADDPAFVGDDLWDGVSAAVDGAIAFYGYYDGFQFLADAYYDDAVPAAAVPLENLDAGDAALLVVHGADDGLVPAEQSVALAEAAGSVGVEATLVVIDGADHAFDGYPSPELTDDAASLIDAIDGFVAVADSNA